MTPREAQLTAALAASQQNNVELKQEIEFLKQKVDSLVRRLFGAKSEKMNPAQLELFMAGIESTEPPSAPAEAAAGVAAGDSLTTLPADPPAASWPKKARRPRLPGDLPIVDEIIDPDMVLANPAAFRCIGQETTEQLDFVRGHFLRRHIIRRKYVRRAIPEQPPSSPRWKSSRNAASPRPPSSPTLSSANTAMPCRSTVWSKSSRPAITSSSSAKPWPVGWPRRRVWIKW